MTWKARVLAWGFTLLPFAVVALMLVILQHLTAQDSSQTLSLKIFPALQWDDPVWLTMSLDRWAGIFAMPWRSYGVVADAIVPILLVVGCIVALIQRRLKWHLGMLAAGALLLLGGIFGPQGIGSTSLIDLRLLTMAALTLSVAVLPDIRFRGAAQILCALAIIAVGARSLWLAEIWGQRQTDMQSLYRAMAPIPAGARVLPLMGQVTDDEPVGRFLGDISPSFEHLPALVVLRRHAFVPTLFAERGKQPLTVKSPYDEDNEPSGGVLGTVADLEAHNGKTAAYLRDWPGRFDYILIVNADVAPLAAIPQACLVSDQGFARLYKIGECRAG